MKEWFLAKEIAGLSGVQNYRIAFQDWQPKKDGKNDKFKV